MKSIDRFCRLVVEINELNDIKENWVSTIDLGSGRSQEEILEDQIKAKKKEFIEIISNLSIKISDTGN